MIYDSLYIEYASKPVIVCGVSAGAFSGACVVEHMKPVLIESSMIPTKNALYISDAKSAFDADGKAVDYEGLTKRTNIALEELFWHADKRSL